MEMKAPAKINLTLDILEKRPDGYHNVETVMQTVDLYDTVWVERGGKGISVTCDKPHVPTDRRNTCYKAAEAFFDTFEITDRNLQIRIWKQIPDGAGLGGGSSDAAAVVRMMNVLYEIYAPEKKLCSVCAKVGADVPFFIEGGLQLCQGIGDKLTQLHTAIPYYIVLAKPATSASTADIYKAYDAEEKHPAVKTPFLMKALQENRPVAEHIGNQMTPVTSKLCPEIPVLLKSLRAAGAAAVEMSGSGSCVYGLFDSLAKAAQAYETIQKQACFAKICRTVR